MPTRTDPITRSLREIYDKVRVSYLSARERPKDYSDKWVSTIETLKRKWDDPSNLGDLFRDKMEENLLFSDEVKDPQGAKAKRVYESIKDLHNDSSFAKDPFRKKYGSELPNILIENKIIYAMFLHWVYRIGRGSLESWKKKTKKEDNLSEGFVGLDLTDKELFNWLEDNYGEDADVSRLKSKLPAARELLYEVFTEEHTPQEWNELVESKKILKGGNKSYKEFNRNAIKEIVDRFVKEGKEVITTDDVISQFWEENPKIAARKGHMLPRVSQLGQFATARLKHQHPQYIKRRVTGGKNTYTLEKMLKEDKGTKNNFIVPNKPMYRIFEIDDMKELKGFTGEWVVQEKYDGMRIQIHKTDTIKVYSFNNRDITSKFDKQIKILKDDKFPECILDAEAVLYKGDDPLHRADTIAYVNADKESNEYNLKIHVFDIMRVEKEDIWSMKLEERLQKLMGQFSAHAHEFLQFPNKKNTRFADSLAEIEEYSEIIMKNPTSEGVIIKDAKSSYIVGKKKNPKWIKWKKFVDLDLIILNVRKNKNGTFSYTLGAGPIIEETEYKPLIELNGEKYLSVGKALNTKIKSKEGNIIRVKVDEVKKTSNGFSIYSAKVIEKPEVTEPEKIITLEFLSKDNKKSASDYNIEALKKSYVITDNVHGEAILNTFLDTDGFVLSGFYENNLMSKNAIIDIDIWKEELKQIYHKDNGVLLTYIQQKVMERDLSPAEIVKVVKEGLPSIMERLFSPDTKNVEKSPLIGYVKEKGEAYGIEYDKSRNIFTYDDKVVVKTEDKMTTYELWQREDGDINFVYSYKEVKFAWRIEQEKESDLFDLFGKADKFRAQVDKEPKREKILDSGKLEIGAQRDGYHEYILNDGKMYKGKLHFRIVPLEGTSKWVAWTGYEQKPVDSSSDSEMWNINSDKYSNTKYIK